MKSSILIGLLLLPISAHAQAPRVFQFTPAALVQVKAHPSPELLALVKHEADFALKSPALTVTSKEQTPPSGDKRDYMSMGAYWWPNPDTPNHLPYVRHDGRRNPEALALPDAILLLHVSKYSRSLALAYYLTGDERYAAHAALLLRAFFITPATAMHPNLNYAQYIPGMNTGRGAGVLDGRDLPMVVDALGLLAGSSNWTAADEAAMHRWFTDYYTWLTTSKSASQENHAPNNHGSWFQQQIGPIALYLGKQDDARAIYQRVRTERIPSQIDAEGMQQFEMVRTQSFSYSAFNLEALTTASATAQQLGVDLFQPAKPGTPGILTAIDMLMVYDPQHKWPHEQITDHKEGSLCPSLYFAAAYTHAAKYKDALHRFECKPTAATLIQTPVD
ncbi:MAG: alginate lyase family protein [Acidobacteriaceae bacterium]|nr:alginate lyase family protein [Acidobacteriaceae bacterium]